MDDKFCSFVHWYQYNKNGWLNKGLILKESYVDDEYRHSYALFFKSNDDLGEGSIILYESNGIYWVDFEAGNFISCEMYIRAGIEFVTQNSLEPYCRQFLEHITMRK